uniref:C2H2-type domain-containing protein n=1 Tax=Physcomitrium patens TaxID=3218 RepID=A0A7I4ACI1_PHYPA
MVHITEMRVVLPLTVEEFRRGQRFANFKTNELNTSEGQGGQLLSTLPYEHETWGEGIYTHSLYRLGDRLPDWVTRLIPSNALILDEKTWMAYPYIRTTISIPFFNKLKIEMLSMHANDDGSTENIHNLTKTELAIRKVDMIDIAFDDVSKRDYRQELDPKLYVSKKTVRGPLRKGWRGNTVPTMCAYKLVKVEANYWGVQNRAEKLMNNGIRQIVLLTHRNAFCWLDEWFDLTLEEITARETLGRQRLKAAVKQPPIIDPKTGQEVIIEPEGPSTKDTDGLSDTSDETSDIEVEYFETEMELGNQDAEQLGTRHIPGSETLFAQTSNIPDRCAVCATRDISNSPPALFCLTCQEYFCQQCFSDFHVTTRLKAHNTQHLLNSLASLDFKSITPADKEHRKKDSDLRPAHGMLQKSVSDVIQSSHSSRNTQEPENIYIRQDERLANIGSPPKESGVARTLSKFRSVKSGFGALNALHRINDLSLQDYSQSGASSVRGVSSDSDLSGLVHRPNELSEELVRTVASLHQRASESHSTGALIRTTSQDFGSSMRKIGRRYSQDITLPDTMTEQKGESVAVDPYGIKEENTAWDIGIYDDNLEVTVLPTESEIKACTALYQRLQCLLEILKNVEPKCMNHEQRLSFWINIYNALMLHATLVHGVPKNHYKRITLMNKVTYIVGGFQYSPLMIEHSILRANSYKPPLANLFPIPKPKKNDDPAASSLDQAEPLVSFALCCGSRSSPVVSTSEPQPFVYKAVAIENIVM